MPPRSRRAGAGGGPILDFEPPETTKKLPPTHIKERILDKALLYAEYVNEKVGVKPELSAIIEKALERAFDEDEGFGEFLSAREGSSTGAAQPAAGSSAADASARTMPEPARRSSASGSAPPNK